jgi:hypothetical protein
MVAPPAQVQATVPVQQSAHAPSLGVSRRTHDSRHRVTPAAAYVAPAQVQQLCQATTIGACPSGGVSRRTHDSRHRGTPAAAYVAPAQVQATVPGHNNRRMPHRAVSPDGPTIPAAGHACRNLPADFRCVPTAAACVAPATGPATALGQQSAHAHRAVSPDGPTIPATGARPRESPDGFPVRSHCGGMPGATWPEPAPLRSSAHIRL